MSKSSKRRLARAAIMNAADTAAAPQRATDIPVGVPLSLLGLPQQPTSPNSKTPLLDSARASSVLSVPSVPYVLPDALSPALNSELSTFNSSPSHSSPSTMSRSSPASGGPLSPEPPLLNSQLPTFNSHSPPASSTSSPPTAPSAPLPLDPPAPSESDFFKTHLEPHCPPQQVDFIELPPIIPDPNNPAGPIDSQLELYQSKLKPIFANLSPDDPNVERITHNYVIVMQIATVERLIHELPGMSESARVETNNQIVRMLSIIERTNSRKSRELRDKDAAARRLIREQQRKERQAQKEAEAIARNQRNKDREDQRREREKAKAELAAQKHELALAKLDLKERNQIAREQANQEKLEHRNAAKSKESKPAPRPIGPPNTWTCG